MCVCVYMYVCVCISVKNICCCFSVIKPCLTLCDPVDCSMPGFPVLYYLLGFAQTYAHWLSDAIQLSHPLPPPSPIALSVYQNYSLLQLALRIRWPKNWNFSISPYKEYSRFISFRVDWFDLLAIQGNLKSLLQHHSSKVSTPVLSLHCGPVLTSVHVYWKKHSFDYMDLCRQSDVFPF